MPAGSRQSQNSLTCGRPVLCLPDTGPQPLHCLSKPHAKRLLQPLLPNTEHEEAMWCMLTLGKQGRLPGPSCRC